MTNQCPVHGCAVSTSYTIKKCRCEACVAWNSARCKAKRAKANAANPNYKKPKLGPPKPKSLHKYCPIKNAEKTKKWRDKNKASIKVRVDAWKADNPERVVKHRRKASRVRRGRKANAYKPCHPGIAKLTDAIMTIKVPGYHLDHKKALADGGSETPWNFTLLRDSVNMSKGAKNYHDIKDTLGPADEIDWRDVLPDWRSYLAA